MEGGADVGALLMDRLLPCLDPSPQRIGDDAQVRRGRYDPFTLVPDGPLHPPGIWVSIIARTIPDMPHRVDYLAGRFRRGHRNVTHSHTRWSGAWSGADRPRPVTALAAGLTLRRF